MKKTIAKTIPAVKARPAKKTEKIVTFCDFGDEPSADGYGNERQCMRCSRDICYTHQTYDPEEISDYGGSYCPICLKLYKEKYEKLYWKFQASQNVEEEKLWQQLRKESLSHESS